MLTTVKPQAAISVPQVGDSTQIEEDPAFQKKTQQTAKRDFDLAERCLKEI